MIVDVIVKVGVNACGQCGYFAPSFTDIFVKSSRAELHISS